MKQPSKHVCLEAQDLACIQLGEGNATTFNHKMLYFSSSALPCFPVSSGRSRPWDIWSSQLPPCSGQCQQHCQPSPFFQAGWAIAAPGPCLLPSLQAGPAASCAQQGQAGRVVSWLLGPSELLSLGLWIGCMRSFHQHRVPALLCSQLQAPCTCLVGKQVWMGQQDTAPLKFYSREGLGEMSHAKSVSCLICPMPAAPVLWRHWPLSSVDKMQLLQPPQEIPLHC